MIERHTFVDMLSDLQEYSEKIRSLETTLDCVFENWMTQHESNMIYHLSRAFFDTAAIRALDFECNETAVVEKQQETVEDLILFYCYDGEFGKKKEKLVNVYERGDIKMDATSAEALFDIIADYLYYEDEDVMFYLS